VRTLIARTEQRRKIRITDSEGIEIGHASSNVKPAARNCRRYVETGM
jgi:hypothetical protein